MHTAVRVLVAACGCLAAACSSPAPQAPPLVSGVDLEAMDTSVRPQDDLFRYVNGTWLERTEIPSDRASWGTFVSLSERAQNDLRAIVEDAAKAPDRAPGSDAQKVGDFYESFLDEARTNELGLTPMADELKAIDALSTKTELARHFARFFKMNLINPVVGFVDGDSKDPGIEALYVRQGGLGLPNRDYYLQDEARMVQYREQYVAFLQTVLDMAGVPGANARAREVFDLELRLARAHWTNVENRDAVRTYNKVAAADLAREFPGFDWSAWLDELGLADADAVIIGQPSYFKAFAAAVNQLPVDRWKPYLKATLLNGFAPYLHKPLLDAEFDMYGKTLRGIAENQPRWKRAVDTLDANLGELVGRLYVERHFTPEAKARMEQLVENLRQAYKLSIDELDWMSADTKQQAQEKLARFRPKIGYPDTWRDYSALEVKRDDLVGNVMRAVRVENEFQLSKVGKPVDLTEWGMTPQTVNAYYHPMRNEIVFPAAILQPPFFNMAADDAVNYGSIGAVIGHEMGHGFDDQGRNYDATGALRDWWTESDAEEYQRRAKILVEQFNAYEPLPGLNVNGELTLGENIADLTGLIIAHRAYMLSLDGKPAPTLDGLSGDERYYMGWARGWASKRREDSQRQQVLVDPHAPEMFRANGPVRNIPHFYETFGVKDGDALFLAPERRVKLW